MTDKKDKYYYITTPIYYVNGAPHIGSSYTNIACDVLARFKRLDGYKVKFLTGTDEHGLKVKQAAEAKGVSPQAFTDEVAAMFEGALAPMNISNDDFIRTTEERHKKAAQALWQKLEEAGEIYLDKYAGWYAVRDEAYYTLDELIAGPDKDTMIAADSGAECKWVEEESYFFKLSEYTDKLLAYYEEHPEFIQPASRRNEVMSFVKGGLRDLSISRTTFDWGVPVPGNEKHVMYVWIDALTNYLTALGYPDTSSEEFQGFWNNAFHMVGKEITRFHCVYWPAFLMAAKLPLPKTVFAHGWLTVEGQKMSKSVGNVITPEELISRYGVDGARFVLLREIPFGNDGNFSHENSVNRINSDLANGLGNLAQRTLSMIAKNCEGKVPHHADFNEEDLAVLNDAYGVIESVRAGLDQFKFHEALQEIFRLVNAANGYIDAQAPWTLKKTDFTRMETVLYVLAETIRCLGILVQPVMPDSASKILDQVAVTEKARDFTCLTKEHALKVGTELPVPQGVFPRLELEEKAA
ncbi:MAG: methionine--tRNA ligase [Micavibrio sp.]|nr:methionine--tRNA ligase [Micavibrio sp.]|tara:strand:+ start:2244 stop:3812 length:1569 start_codon:yes stop_codon:yes gene_type:complete